MSKKTSKTSQSKSGRNNGDTQENASVEDGLAAARIVLIHSEPVELYKILKFEGLAASGAEAKNLIANGHVCVNAEIETRRRRKMHDGDHISVGDESMQLRLELPDSASS